ncbi:MAG: molybdenum cofactor biosynthesis protein MoaE [Planctomycetota bacterium]
MDSGSLRVEVRLFASLRERVGAESIVVDDVPPGTTIADLKELAAIQHPALGDLGSVAGVVGTEYVGGDRRIEPGDDVAFLPPVSGGVPEGDPLERGVFELASGPIDPGELQRRVSHPTCGAVVLFTGQTRDTNRGKSVDRLDYEAFEEMGGPEMRRIFAECVERFGPTDEVEQDRTLRMLCVHRTGVVGVGDPSVVIAVASPHRDAAFLAARFLIDTLKERLPVWKKEVYADGHHWIGDRS